MPSLIPPAWELPHGLGELQTTKLVAPALPLVKAEADIEHPPTSIEAQDTDSIDTPGLTVGSSASSVEDEAEAKIPATTETEHSHIKHEKPHDYTKQFFPNHPGPSNEGAKIVYDRLCGAHGVPPPQPAVLPPASTERAGCGDVQNVQEAVQRTSISGNVTMAKANEMLQALVKAFPAPKDSIWTIDWEYILCNITKEQLEKALKTGRGGMHKVKARLITRALKTIYEGNIKRADALKEELISHVPTPMSADYKQNIPGFPALSNLTDAKKGTIIKEIDKDPLSLNWLHELENDHDILNVLITINGVQTKTASCVTLFSLQRPSFAVDTHVHRFCNWLGWVPPGTNPEKTFYHCDPKIPNHLKYALHQLFIRHGQTCFRCTGKSKPGSAQWDNTVCVLEDLLDRSVAHKKSSKNGPKSKKVEDIVDGEAEEGGEEGVEENMEESSVHLAGAGVKAGKRHREDDDDEYKEKPAKKQRASRAKKFAAPKKAAVSKKVAAKKVLSPNVAVQTNIFTNYHKKKTG